MITLEQARARIGDGVIYRAPHPGAIPEQGVITSVSELYVFVRYGCDSGAKATSPDALEFLAPGGTT